MEKDIMKDNILIISESFDKSTNNVLEWFYHYKFKSTRNNVDNDNVNFNIQINNKSTSTTLNQFIIWNRRGYLPIIPIEARKTEWLTYLKSEQLPVLFTLEMLNSKNYIGSYFQEFSNNKITNLGVAVESGFEIPDTIVTNNKKDLLKFINCDKVYITKSLSMSPSLENADSIYSGSGTIELDINAIEDNFAPSLVQECITKEVEIRVFFIENYFYSVAIFSQNDGKTKIDFRNYNFEKPNRIVPFLLPDEILRRIRLFVKKISCNTGSIDLILTPNKKFVFLEINPMGQYDWLSGSCNYYIDKKIAEILIQKRTYVQ